MSFSSVLPTPQVLLKSGGVAAPPPPALTGTDSATGADTLVSLTVAVSSTEARAGIDAVTLCTASLLPAPDVAKTLDALAVLLATLTPAPDRALATDTLTQYYALVTPAPDAGRGGDLLTLLYTGVIYAFDSSIRTLETVTFLGAQVSATEIASGVEQPALAGIIVFGRRLRVVGKGDIILPSDQNELVDVWGIIASTLDVSRRALSYAKPEFLDAFDSYANEIKRYVSAMPRVKEGDPVYSEHFNLHLYAVRKMIEMRRWLASDVFPELTDISKPADDAEWQVIFVWEKRTGDIVSSFDWNAVKYALSALYMQIGLFEVPYTLFRCTRYVKQADIILERFARRDYEKRADIILERFARRDYEKRADIILERFARQSFAKPVDVVLSRFTRAPLAKQVDVTLSKFARTIEIAPA
jgi:succinate dehydrogenase flavin-adding protein (antitoxin of CptAB toxin-antitoxin module)